MVLQKLCTEIQLGPLGFHSGLLFWGLSQAQDQRWAQVKQAHEQAITQAMIQINEGKYTRAINAKRAWRSRLVEPRLMLNIHKGLSNGPK